MNQPIICNRQWDRAERRARAWADRMGLLAAPDEMRRLERMGQGRMAGFVAPWADPAELELLAQWGAFISLVDDSFDRGAGNGSPSHVRAFMDSLVAVVDGPATTPDVSVPAVRAIVDLWNRSTPATSPPWARRFAACYRDFADATCEESLLRAGRTPLALSRYVELRRHTITVLPMLALVERGLSGEGSGLEGLRGATADLVAWTNDLASAERESAEGTDNLVSILARERRCTHHEAAAIARTMISGRMEAFDAAAATALAQGPHSAGLRIRVDRIRSFLYGALAWQGETRRNDPEATAPAPAIPLQAGPEQVGDDPPPYGPAPGSPGSWQAPADVPRSIERLTRHLSLAVSPAGAVPDRCAGRVLESALFLALLRAARTHEPQQEQLTLFLRTRRAAADPVDALLIDACLHPAETAGRAGRAVAELTGQLNRGTGGRGRFKAVMMRAVLHLLCDAPLADDDLLPSVPPDRITTYTDVNLLAIRVICARATGHPHMVTGAERDRLVDSLDAGRHRLFWEAGATTHLLALHAVRGFRPGHPVVDDGILRMTLAQNRDGGLPFLDSQDLWLAAVAGLVFLADDRLRPLTGRMGEFVASWQAPDGGWPFASAMTQTDLDTTTRCMEFLQASAPERYASQLRRATRYLEAMAGPDGGFPTWVSGDAPDLDMTAGALLALAPTGRHHALLTRAAGFVLDAQQPDGTFERSWTISESSGILRALNALHAVPQPSASLAARIAEATARAVSHLTAVQNADGGWGREDNDSSDVLSTAQAVPVLARHGDHACARRGIGYLLAHQDSDGGFTSVPDQTGPRPLPFDFPVLASLHTLPALLSAASLAQDPATALSPSSAPRRRVRSGARTQGTVDWSALDARMSGTLLEPHDAGYEQARLVVNQRYDDVRPQAVAYPATAEDVAMCVSFARERGVRLTIRSGGHSYAGYSTGPGLVVHLRELNSITVGAGRVRLGAGTLGMAAHMALAASGAGLPLGRCPSIGVAGATLGGGLSAFTRSWGLAIDHLTGVDIVTADGRLRSVDAHSSGADRDLYWAMLGGGGGNFGVVTALDYTTVDISDMAFTSIVMRWPMKDMSALIQGWTAWNADPDLPRELRTAIEQLSDRGAPSELVVTGTFIGTPREVQPLLDSLVTAVGRPESDRVAHPVSYVQAAAEPERWGWGTVGPRVAFAAKSHIVRRPMTPAAADDMVAAVDRLHRLDGVSGAGGLLIESLGGAVNDTAPDATAFPHRSAVGVVQYHSYWHEFTPRPHIEQRMQWLRDIHTAMHPHLGTGGYVNGIDPELDDWEAAYHGDNHPRLRRVKAAVDPDQFFTQPQAITPATTPFTTTVTAPTGSRPTVRAHGQRSDSALTRLAGRLHGRLLRPGDPDYDKARVLHNQRYDGVMPAAIARIEDEDDAAACLAYAAETGTATAVRAGGHNYAGFSTTPGLVIDVAALNGIAVSRDRVRLGAGVSSTGAGRTLARSDLAIAAGRWGSVGVAGLTLGGGKSAFTRAWGLSCDRLTGATIVTPDGRTRHLTRAPEDPDHDLFWALRGAGGGNFGVITALEFQPVDITGRSFAHFRIQWTHADMASALRGWQHWITDPRTPREVSCDVRILLDGSGPSQPIVHGAWIGDTPSLLRVIDRLITAVGRPPKRIGITPGSYVESAMVTDHPLRDSSAHSAWPSPAFTDPGTSNDSDDTPGGDDRMAWAGKSHIVRAPMTDAATAILIDGINDLHRLGATGGFYLDSLGGAVGDMTSSSTAFPHRNALAVLQYITTWPRTCPPSDSAAQLDSMRNTHTAMQTHLGPGAYVNDTDPELHGWEHAYYADNYPRLQQVKATYDPGRVLDFPQAVRAPSSPALPTQSAVPTRLQGAVGTPPRTEPAARPLPPPTRTPDGYPTPWPNSRSQPATPTGN
ncbi:FAD-binding protein [Streptomyces subrutilus]|uniref:FAD-binding protein n=1 Tax=Streptomyces subrutilus TaxID=36818 RepID=UPI0034233A9D